MFVICEGSACGLGLRPLSWEPEASMDRRDESCIILGLSWCFTLEEKPAMVSQVNRSEDWVRGHMRSLAFQALQEAIGNS